jgi:hypothetical protein
MLLNRLIANTGSGTEAVHFFLLLLVGVLIYLQFTGITNSFSVSYKCHIIKVHTKEETYTGTYVSVYTMVVHTQNFLDLCF